ncbi:hypothetical protein HC891_20175 [Candidatus Gracilibacteria bacterium]|nr:hypothetical protein [Candidatus Gracilibacteria bacterium]
MSLALPVVAGGGMAVRAAAHVDDVAAAVTTANKADTAVDATATSAGRLNSVGERGEELADASLIDAVKQKGRNIYQDDESVRMLDHFGANASAANATDITLRPDARKIEVLEEYLHTTQYRRGMDKYMTTAELELHVKGFMVRHQRMLGISANDVAWLQKSMDMYRGWLGS